LSPVTLFVCSKKAGSAFKADRLIMRGVFQALTRHNTDEKSLKAVSVSKQERVKG
jgi:hypothetical protein